MSGAWALLGDMCWMGLLLLIGQLLRAKLRPVQALHLPASVIAGALGLLAGPQVLDLIPFSASIGEYAWLLVVLLFASIVFSTPPVGSVRAVMNRAGGTFLFNMSAEIGLFAFAILAGLTLLPALFPEVESSFAVLMPAGFVGGHGYAAAIGGSLQETSGPDSAIAIGFTFATIGLVSSILIGVPLIRWGVRRGYSNVVADMSTLPESLRTGMLDPDERPTLGSQTISPSSLDPLAFHAALVGLAALSGYYLTAGIKAATANLFGVSFYLPEMATAMVCGLLIKKIATALGIGGTYIDRQVMSRLGGTVTDWLVGFGIASIKLTVVSAYIAPIAVMCLVGYASVLLYVIVLAPRMTPRYWFERAVFVFGWCTGVVAMGITLLRIADPESKSGTLEAYGMAYVLIAPVELILVSTLPIAAANGLLWTAGLLLLCLFATMIYLGMRLASDDQAQASPESAKAAPPRVVVRASEQ